MPGVGLERVQRDRAAPRAVADARALELEQALGVPRERDHDGAGGPGARPQPADERAAADLRIDHALRRERLVRGCHGVAIHVEALRERADRRQPLAARESPVLHLRRIAPAICR